MFPVCITKAMANVEKYRPRALAWFAPKRKLARPLSKNLFAGRLDFGQLLVNLDTLLLRALVTFGVFPRGDPRDGETILSWAESLKTVFGT